MRIMVHRGGSAARLPGAIASADRAPAPQVSRSRQLFVVAGWLLGVVVAFACYLRLARTRAVDSDGASQALQAWDMLHGNLLLHGWWLSDVSFYTTELPEYMLVELVRGLNSDVVHVAAAITYTLVLLFAALLAKGTATGRAAVVRVLMAVGLMVAPQLAEGVKILVASPDHIGTSVPVLAAFLILDRAPRRPWVPVVVSALLGWAAIADTLVLFIGVVPVALVCLLQPGSAGWAAQRWRPRWYFVGIGAGSLAAGAAAEVVPHLIRSAGGFVLWPPAFQALSGVHALPHTLNITGQGLLLLAGADFLGLGPGALTDAAFLHLAGVIVLGLGVLLAVRRFGRDLGFVDQILLTAVALNLASYVFSTQAGSIDSTREIAIVLPLSAVLAARMLADRVLAIRFAPAVLLVVLAGYVGGLGYELVQPSAPPETQQFTSWLAAHHLDSGLSGYWQANVVTLTSGDRILVRPLTVKGARVVSYEWNSAASWYNPHVASANFVVLLPVVGRGGYAARKYVVATFGEPVHTYRVGSSLILVWHKNLLLDLARSGSAP
jgi:hypothetical protein